MPKCDTCGGEMKPLFSSFFCPEEDKPDHGAQIKLKKDTEESLKAWYRAWGYAFPADLVNLNIILWWPDQANWIRRDYPIGTKLHEGLKQWLTTQQKQ